MYTAYVSPRYKYVQRYHGLVANGGAERRETSKLFVYLPANIEISFLIFNITSGKRKTYARHAKVPTLFTISPLQPSSRAVPAAKIRQETNTDRTRCGWWLRKTGAHRSLDSIEIECKQKICLPQGYRTTLPAAAHFSYLRSCRVERNGERIRFLFRRAV